LPSRDHLAADRDKKIEDAIGAILNFNLPGSDYATSNVNNNNLFVLFCFGFMCFIRVLAEIMYLRFP